MCGMEGRKGENKPPKYTTKGRGGKVGVGVRWRGGEGVARWLN